MVPHCSSMFLYLRTYSVGLVTYTPTIEKMRLLIDYGIESVASKSAHVRFDLPQVPHVSEWNTHVVVHTMYLELVC